VAPTHRGGGVAHRLVDMAEDFARAHGAARLRLWSDTRFDRAHRFYEKRGYVRQEGVRELHDLSNSVEYHYVKP
jgi:GNAT superfamily N-acetyltransferase